MWEWIVSFWSAQSSNIITSVIVGFLFFVLGPLGLWFSGKKIRKERNKKARESLMDILEGMIVSQTKIDKFRLDTIRDAVEREVVADLAGEYSHESLLSDVALRFEKSKHLSADQKNSYYESILKIRESLKEKDKVPDKDRIAFDIPRDIRPVLVEINQLLSESKDPRALELMKAIEQKLIYQARSRDPLLGIFQVYLRIYERSPVTFLFWAVVFLIAYIFFVSWVVRS